WLSRGTDWISTQLGEDGLHPNVTGYQTLFSEIMSWKLIEQQ
ncbi:MAG: hypothetical protein RLZZ171_210, partial [Cyanobacteriota bacterium]